MENEHKSDAVKFLEAVQYLRINYPDYPCREETCKLGRKSGNIDRCACMCSAWTEWYTKTFERIHRNNVKERV